MRQLHARGWLEPFFGWHNDDHQHSGLALFTPAEVFFGRVAAVHRVRQDALDAQYALRPARFPNGPPKAALPPSHVHINPLEALALPVQHAVASPSINAPLVVDTLLPFRSQLARHAAAIPSHGEFVVETGTLPS